MDIRGDEEFLVAFDERHLMRVVFRAVRDGVPAGSARSVDPTNDPAIA
jgi:hypothetical protein